MTGPRPAIKIKAEKKVLLYQTQLDELDSRLREDDELFAFIVIPAQTGIQSIDKTYH